MSIHTQSNGRKNTTESGSFFKADIRRDPIAIFFFTIMYSANALCSGCRSFPASTMWTSPISVLQHCQGLAFMDHASDSVSLIETPGDACA